MKIIVAHPSKQHSFYTAIALKKSGMLFKYITSVYDKKGTLTYFFKFILNKKNKNKATTRKIEELDNNDILILYELSALILLIIRRIPFFNKLFYNKIFNYRRKKFGIAVAKYAIKNKVDAVIMYDSTALECFSILKKEAPNIKRILDVSIVNRLYMKKNFEEDIKRTNNNSLKKEEAILWSEKLMKYYVDEVLLSDYFFAPSQIVKKSLIYAGAHEENIFLIPYGVDLKKFSYKQKVIHSLPLKMIYVGQISYRKGIHHLLEAVKNIGGNYVNLILAGSYNPKSDLYLNYKDVSNIHFLGFITRDILEKYYQDSDVFIFPTLGEGYGLVVLESLSTGTPVITSDLAGGNDIIKDGYNGYVFEAGNNVDMINKLSIILNNMDQLPSMSANSYKSVLNMSWENYYKKIQDAIFKINPIKN